jgi:hypothetical protein
MAGGIAGIICGGNGTKESSTRIERCFAAGTITVADVIGTTNQNQWSYIGGIVGYVYYGGWVSQCYFDGRVIVNRINDCTGGIAGYSSYAIGDVAGSLAGTFSQRLCVIEDCWSDGEVIGYNNAGGIVGQNQQNALLRRTYSRMAVSVINNANGPNTYTQWGVGGIAGSHSSTNPPDAILACAALNRSISASLGDEIHRITGRMQEAGGVMPKMTNNYALPDLIPVTNDPAKSYAADKGLFDKADGEDIPDEYISNGKPVEAFYKLIGWDFVNVWKMGSDGYPKLGWQD